MQRQLVGNLQSTLRWTLGASQISVLGSRLQFDQVCPRTQDCCEVTPSFALPASLSYPYVSSTRTHARTHTFKRVYLQVATFEAAIVFLLQQGKAQDSGSLSRQSEGTNGQAGASPAAAAWKYKCCSIGFVCLLTSCDIVWAATRGQVLRWSCSCF